MSEKRVQKLRLTWMILILIYLSSVVFGQAINLPVRDNATPVPQTEWDCVGLAARQLPEKKSEPRIKRIK
jgi:hypothetical protein